MKEFERYHPIVNFTYFLFVIGFSMFFMNPLCLVASFLSAFSYSVMLGGKKSLKFNFLYMFPVVIGTFILNPLFNHSGTTILFYLPTGNPLTLESVLYGISAGFMLVTVICWFSCYNKVMTSEKFIYLFGRIIPSLSLILSMTLRFVPRFLREMKKMVLSQKCVGNDIANGSIIKRAKGGAMILSSMLTWSLENSIETSDSMKARGYGLSGRTSFSIYTLKKRDTFLLSFILVLAVYVLIGAFLGSISFNYFPEISGAKLSIFGISIFVSYFVLCILPIIIEIFGGLKWKSLK